MGTLVLFVKELTQFLFYLFVSIVLLYLLLNLFVSIFKTILYELVKVRKK